MKNNTKQEKLNIERINFLKTGIFSLSLIFFIYLFSRIGWAEQRPPRVLFDLSAGANEYRSVSAGLVYGLNESMDASVSLYGAKTSLAEPSRSGQIRAAMMKYFEQFSIGGSIYGRVDPGRVRTFGLSLPLSYTGIYFFTEKNPTRIFFTPTVSQTQHEEGRTPSASVDLGLSQNISRNSDLGLSISRYFYFKEDSMLNRRFFNRLYYRGLKTAITRGLPLWSAQTDYAFTPIENLTFDPYLTLTKNIDINKPTKSVGHVFILGINPKTSAYIDVSAQFVETIKDSLLYTSFGMSFTL
ncbi:MAG: hypothetical protein AB7F43_12150 [Bacteriovoracia bacterium]